MASTYEKKTYVISIITLLVIIGVAIFSYINEQNLSIISGNQHNESLGKLENSTKNITESIKLMNDETQKSFEKLINTTSSLKKENLKLSLEISPIGIAPKFLVDGICNSSWGVECYSEEGYISDFSGLPADYEFNSSTIKIRNKEDIVQKNLRFSLTCDKNISFYKIIVSKFSNIEVQSFSSSSAINYIVLKFKFDNLPPNGEIILGPTFVLDGQSMCQIQYYTDESGAYNQVLLYP